MSKSDALSAIREEVPEFAIDPAFADLPYVVFGDFAQFLIDCIHQQDVRDETITRAFALINRLHADPVHTNLIEVAVFETIADDLVATKFATRHLNEEARKALARYTPDVGPPAESK